MSVDLSLICETLRQNLSSMGITPIQVAIDSLDETEKAFLVTVLADTFEGQTYLDREMRLRPPVARAFAQHGLMRAKYVIEAKTPEENESSEMSVGEGLDSETKSATEERLNRARWHKMVESVKRALRASGYRLEELEENMLVAVRSALAHEKILIGFAKSVVTSTVDLDTRKKMQTAQSSQRFASHYYLVPSRLDSPLSNQRPAQWLTVITTSEFIHRLNSSTLLAEKLREVYSDTLDTPLAEYAGPIIEPALRPEKPEDEAEPGFFAFLEKWMNTSGSNLMVLMAPAGHGKTTLLQELTRRLATQFLKSGAGDSAPVPLLVPFESVRRTVDFDSLMHKRLAELCAGSYGAFAELLKSGRAILLVDGFDELADDAGTNVAEAQVRSMRPLLEGEAKVILAGRSVFTQMFAGDQSVSNKVRSLLGDVAVTEAEILPFSVEKVFEYVESRTGLTGEQKGRLIDYVESSPDHAELASNPLFLRILSALAASGTLPSTESPVEQIDSLLEQVCRREEERQHLGIGVPSQLDFLGWVASEIFKSSRTVISRADVELMASEMVSSLSGSGSVVPEIVGRLVGHALLTTGSERSITFIHPLIRDVLLARVINESELNVKSGKFISGSSVSLRDLPEGTVQHLAMRIKEWDSLLNHVDHIPSQARRNILRIATRFAYSHLGEGNPRDWLRAHWGGGKRIAGVDFSLLSLESTSFDDCRFLQCDFSMTTFEDCDFRNTVFEDCKLALTAFVDCRADGVKTIGGAVSGAYVIRRNQNALNASRSLNHVDDFIRELTSDSSAEVEDNIGVIGEKGSRLGPVSVDSTILRRCRELVASLLRQLVQAEPTERFYTISLHHLHVHTDDGREQMAMNRVIVPLLLNRICAQNLAGGSQVVISVEKHWRPAVIAFLRQGRLSRNLSEFIHQAAAKAARFFS